MFKSFMRSPWLIDHINKPFAFEKADFHRREQQPKKFRSAFTLVPI